MVPALVPALLRMKCPRCRKGNVFVDPNPYHLKRVGDMYALCPVCSHNFRPEPGYFFGGAIVSYPLMVIFNLMVAIAFHFITGNIFDHVFALMITLTVASLLVTPAFFRYSRIIFLYIFVRYKKET